MRERLGDTLLLRCGGVADLRVQPEGDEGGRMLVPLVFSERLLLDSGDKPRNDNLVESWGGCHNHGSFPGEIQ